MTFNGLPVDPGTVTDGRLPLTDLAGSNSLAVDATIAVSGSGAACPVHRPGRGSQYIVANCFPTAAPSIFCCFDQPDLRAASP